MKKENNENANDVRSLREILEELKQELHWPSLPVSAINAAADKNKFYCTRSSPIEEHPKARRYARKSEVLEYLKTLQGQA